MNAVSIGGPVARNELQTPSDTFMKEVGVPVFDHCAVDKLVVVE